MRFTDKRTYVYIESMYQDFEQLWHNLQHSTFRSRFSLSTKDLTYYLAKTPTIIQQHAEKFIATRLAPAYPINDGKQTPWRGHPVFIAQHATATCCRSCLAKWHQLPAGKPLSLSEQHYTVEVIMIWLSKQVEKQNIDTIEDNPNGSLF